MTSFSFEELTCAICGKKRYYSRLSSWRSEPWPVMYLDLRGLGAVSEYMVQRCPKCGYCSSNIARVVDKEKVHAVVKSKTYRRQLKNRKFTSLGNSFFCQSMIDEQNEKFADAAWSLIYCAWTCDDTRFKKKSAVKCRKEAVRLMKEAKERGQCFIRNERAYVAILVDLLRRSGQFDEALELVESVLCGKIVDGLRQILSTQKELILSVDTAAHTTTESIHRRVVKLPGGHLDGRPFTSSLTFEEESLDLFCNKNDDEAVRKEWMDKNEK